MKKASISTRIGAYVIDKIISVLPFMVLYSCFAIYVLKVDGSAGMVVAVISWAPNTIMIYMLFSTELTLAGISEYMDTVIPIVLILCLLFICMELIFKGRTFGQKTIRVEVVTKDGEQPTFARRVVRNFAKAIGMALYPISLVYYIIKRETPWDTVTKTMVIDKEK